VKSRIAPSKFRTDARPASTPSQSVPRQEPVPHQREVVDNGSGRPGENLTNYLDVQTVCRPIPEHRTVRWTNEVPGCGLYRGPSRQYWLNKTGYDRSKSPCGTEMQPDIRWNPRSTDTPYAPPGQHHYRHWPERPGQKPHAAGIDGKSLTELL